MHYKEPHKTNFGFVAGYLRFMTRSGFVCWYIALLMIIVVGSGNYLSLKLAVNLCTKTYSSHPLSLSYKFADCPDTILIKPVMEQWEWEKSTKDELENQMSPSRWNPTKSADEVISQHISVCANETLQARQRIPCKLDISYGASDRQKYDLYGTDLPHTATIVLWIHGGYWQEGSKDIAAVTARTLYENGIKTIVLGYTLAPEVSVGKIQTEVHSALTKAMLDHKEATFIVAGHSAGAMLGSRLLHENTSQCEQHVDVNNRVSGFLLFSGVYDLRPLIPTYINGALKLTRNEAEVLSPLLQPLKTSIKRDIPILVMVGGFDSPEFQRQSRLYAEKLQAMYENVQMWTSCEDDHFTLVERLSCSALKASSPANRVLDFFKSMKLIK